jgi:A/G-specific adenine glycosylase
MSALPGIGRSTAAAILAQAQGDRHAILDGNVKRLLCRLFAVEGWPGSGRVEKQLWPLSESLLPDTRLADFTQAVMDFGATLCTRTSPACALCPFQHDCRARIEGRVHELPSPRPAKTLPERRCVMVLLQDDSGAVLLERRPPVGVWAGLWSLPQFDDEASGRAWASQDARGAGEALPRVDHVFSHYRLQIQPLRWRNAGNARRIGDNADLRWASATDLTFLGLPAPVRRLLETTFGEPR